jgi:hypothetical protein
MKVILIPIILALFILFYKKNSLVCLGIFGLSYYIANCCTKNKDLCFFVASLSSFYIFQHIKVIEGNTEMNDILGCNTELDDSQILACDPSVANCDWTAKKLKGKKTECTNIIKAKTSEKASTSNPQTKQKIEEELGVIKNRVRIINESLQKCHKYQEETNCINPCKWGKIGGNEPSCN